MRIAELMSHAEACYARDSLAKGARRIQENEARCAPVVDREGRVVGLLTEADVARAAATLHSPPFEAPASVVMQRAPASVLPGEDLEKAHERMREARARCLVVVDDDGRLQGLLTLDDLARHAVREMRLDGRTFWAEQLIRTLGCCTGERRIAPAAA